MRFWFSDRSHLEGIFPIDYASYFQGHETRINEPMLVVMVETGDYGAFSEPVWNLLDEIDSIIKFNSRYASTCARHLKKASAGSSGARYNDDVDTECVSNEFLELRSHLDAIRNRKYNLSFPLASNPGSRKQYFLPKHFGGVSLVSRSTSIQTLSSAKVIRLSYPLDPSSPMAEKVEKELWREIRLLAPTKNFSVFVAHSQSINEDLHNNIYQVFKYFIYPIYIYIYILYQTL